MQQMKTTKNEECDDSGGGNAEKGDEIDCDSPLWEVSKIVDSKEEDRRD